MSSYSDERSACSNNMERFNLVDQVMDEMGLGRFHILLFLLASLGYFVEAAEMSILSLLYPQFLVEWNVEQTELSIIGSLTGVGMILGTGFFGRLADNAGRKVVYQISLSLCIIIGFFSSYATNVDQFAVMRMFLGFAYGGNIVSSSTLLLENSPSIYRGYLSGLLQFAFAFGQLFVIIVSWIFMDSLGWAWVVRIISLVGTPVLVGLFFMPGSVRFYIINEQYDKAYDAVISMCNRNGSPVPSYFTLENLAGINTKEIRVEKNICIDLSNLFGERSLRTVLVPLMSVWMLNAFGHGLNSFLPVELKAVLGGEFIQYKIALAQAVGAFIGAFVVSYVSTRMKRITELRLGLSILAFCVFSFSFLAEHVFLLIFFVMIESVGVGLTFHVLYTYTPEVFPTSIRVTAFSMCQMGNRIAPVFSPFLVTFLSSISFRLCSIVYSMIFVAALLVTVFLRTETFNQKMVESHAEQVNSVDDGSDEFELSRRCASSSSIDLQQDDLAVI